MSLLYVLFISLFALDVFSEYHGQAIILPLLIHLIPSLIVLIIITISWRYEIVGAITFLCLALLYVFIVGFHHPWSWYLLISGPATGIGILFLIIWISKK